MINAAHGISFFIDLGLPGWPHEPGRAPNRPLGGHVNQLAARVKTSLNRMRTLIGGVKIGDESSKDQVTGIAKMVV